LSPFSQIASKETIPREDLKVSTEEDLEKGLDLARRHPLQEEKLGGDLVDLINSASHGNPINSQEPGGGSPKDRWGWKRWLVNSVQIAWGGGLVAADLSLAAKYILTGIGLSVAGTPVGVALGAAVSIHTGGKNVIEALKEMVTQLES
jgi:hypothetical protein